MIMENSLQQKEESSLKDRQQQSTRITLLGAFCNIFLGVVKCLVGWLGHSHALFADGVHSIADLFADGVVLVASKLGNEKADSEHPYGHRRIETVATIIVAVFLLSAGVAIMVDGYKNIFDVSLDRHMHFYVLWIAILALVINEGVFQLTMRVAKKIQSEMLVAHAWHRRSDAAVSLIVLIGIIGSLMGFYYLDGIASVVIGIFILRMAVVMGYKAINELIDRGLSETELAKITMAIDKVPGVLGIHQLRTRLSGGKILADVHLMVSPLISVSEGHYISEKVYLLLQKEFPALNDVTVHVDSEDDEWVHNNLTLPSRAKILAVLTALKKDLPFFDQMELKQIHYSGHRVMLELIFPLDVLMKMTKSELQTQYLNVIHTQLSNADVQIFFQ